jgi:hypothetical protein
MNISNGFKKAIMYYKATNNALLQTPIDDYRKARL